MSTERAPFPGFDKEPDFTLDREALEEPKHIVEQATKADEDFESAVKANEIVEKVVEDFHSTGNVVLDAQRLKKKLTEAGIDFEHLGNRGAAQTAKFMGKILGLKVADMDKVRTDYRMDTINAIEELSYQLYPDGLADVRRRANAA